MFVHLRTTLEKHDKVQFQDLFLSTIDRFLLHDGDNNVFWTSIWHFDIIKEEIHDLNSVGITVERLYDKLLSKLEESFFAFLTKCEHLQVISCE